MRTTFALILGVLTAPLALAQEGPFRGSITTGYRFTDVKGYEPKFQELFDLNSGLRLLDLSLFGQVKTPIPGPLLAHTQRHRRRAVQQRAA
jgi:hypothetical protein